MTSKERQESLFVFLGVSPGALVIPVEDECIVIQTKYFLPDPRGAGTRRLGPILNIYVLHLLLQNIYRENTHKKNLSEISSGS